MLRLWNDRLHPGKWKPMSIESGSTSSSVSGSLIQGLRSALAPGNSDLNKLTTAAILLATSKLRAFSAAFTPNTPTNVLSDCDLMVSDGQTEVFHIKIAHLTARASGNQRKTRSQTDGHPLSHYC